MFRNSHNVLVSGGSFTYQDQQQHHHHTSPSVFNTKKSAMDRLMEASSLGALHNSGERFDPPKCHPKTRIAVLQRLTDWFIRKLGWETFVLWLYGPAGAGKSAIAQTFAEQCFRENGLLASFFFSRSDPKRNNEKALVATLAYQVSLRIPESRTIIETAIDKDPAIFQLNFETQFQTLIVDPLLQLSGLFVSGEPFPCLIIIDGLDECKGSEIQSTILNTISNTLQYQRSTLPLMFLIASRPEHHLTIPYSGPSLNNLTLRLALDDTYQPEEDIRLYLIDSFYEIRKTHIMRADLPDSWPSEEDIDKLVTKSSGQFIYAATVIRYVSSPRHNPLDRLKVIHGLLPVNNDKPYAQLDALYINVLSGVEGIKAALRVLGLSLVMGNVTIYDLKQFMRLSPGAIQLLLINLLSVVDASNNTEPIKLFHASFSDFLFDPTRSLQFYIDPSKVHEEAARLCVSHINSFWISVAAGGNAFPDTFDADFVQLVCTSLFGHLRQAGPLLYDNASLRKEVLNMPYVHFLNGAKRWFWDDRPYFSTFRVSDALTEFLSFLQTSSLRDTQELYLRHRGIWDQQMREDLALVPQSPGLAFWTATCVGIALKHVARAVFLETITALLPSSSTSGLFLYVTITLFTAEISHDMVFNTATTWLQEADGQYVADGQYLALVTTFLNDPSRAGPHVVNQVTYTTAAEFAAAFVIRPWDGKKSSVGSDRGQWDLIWDAFVFVLSRAGHSDNLITLLSQRSLIFSLGRPDGNVHDRLRSMFNAVSDYLLRCTGTIPAGFNIAIDWTQWKDVTYKPRYLDDIKLDTVFYLDESINGTRENANTGIVDPYFDGSIDTRYDSDVQGHAELKRAGVRAGMRVRIAGAAVRVGAYTRSVLLPRRSTK